MAAVDGIALQIFKRVMHEAHVPLESETEPTRMGRLRDARPGGRFLSDRRDPGAVAVSERVHPFEELDRLDILIPTKLVREPLACLSRIVEIEHRGDGIDPQAVGMVALEPEERVVDEEV